MRIPSNSELLALWECGSVEDPISRALTILFFCTGEPRDMLAQLSIGARDRMLLEIYECLFGSSLDAFAKCSSCSEPLQYSLSTRDLIASPLPPDEPLLLTTGDARLRLRLPDSLALAAVSGCTDLALATRLLTEHCILEAFVGGETVLPHALPEHLMEPVSAAIAAADPAADLRIDLHCAACAHSWQVVFDIERFFWAKLSSMAKRLLREVHALASAYGWSESDILALSSPRRQVYMEMAWQA